MCVVDGSGRVTLWNDALERIAGVSREQALGAPLVSAMPALANTELPRAIGETLKDRTPRDDRESSAGARRRSADSAGQVAAGVGWPDAALAGHHRPNERRPCSEAQRRAARARRRGRERRMVGMGPSHEGVLLLGRWREIVGLPGEAGIGRPEEWLDRVHPEDVGFAEGCAESASLGQDAAFSTRAPHPAGRRDLPDRSSAAVLHAAERAESATRIAGSLTDTTDHALAQQQLRSAGFRDPLTGLRNRADFVDGLGQPARAIQAAASRRRTIRDSLSRPRPLQGGERQPGPPRGRRDADRGVAAPRVVPA